MKGKNRKTTSGLRATRLVTHNPEVWFKSSPRNHKIAASHPESGDFLCPFATFLDIPIFWTPG